MNSRTLLTLFDIQSVSYITAHIYFKSRDLPNTIKICSNIWGTQYILVQVKFKAYTVQYVQEVVTRSIALYSNFIYEMGSPPDGTVLPGHSFRKAGRQQGLPTVETILRWGREVPAQPDYISSIMYEQK